MATLEKILRAVITLFLEYWSKEDLGKNRLSYA